MHARRVIARIALAVTLAAPIACSPPNAANGGVGPAPSSEPWTARGDAQCRTLPTEPPPCPATLNAPEGVAVWLINEVVPLRQALTVMVFPNVSQGELAMCNLRTLPLPRTCNISTTCPGADIVIPAAYLRGIALQYVSNGFRCW